ncbi:M3 family metallopeptidase [Subtercola endophyticus]|uniref:M3 family metallopeptidase n=1 Tax=Subtercola endophyticus TaxID=2895559 RepID=UPI001E4534BF|nr:M3 family metallopeptidase [Subtercola endophyticus]UFS57439.1 M3 family metallopeptidase [Subtercola endophyticus]
MPNPFFEPSPLEFGLPPFADIRDEHYAPAFERGFAEHLAEIEEILAETDAPTLENTLIPLERAGQTLSRVSAVFFNKASADSTDFTNELEEQLAPQLAAHSDAIRLNSALYSRIRGVYENRDTLDAESRYLAERYYAEFTQAGAGLSDDDKSRLRHLNSELSTLTTRFEKNLLADTNELAVVIDTVASLDGLGEGEISAAAAAATERGMPGKYVITLVLPTGHPYLASLTDRAVRERIMTASRSRGTHGCEHDNREIVLQITRLRAERAALLGFATHAAFVTSDETAQTPEAVDALLRQLAGPAARNARAEQAALQQLAVRETGDASFELQAWDWAFYSEKVRKATYDVDTAEMRPYFEASRVLNDGVFFAAHRLYGVTFTERFDLVAYHPEVRVFEVRNEDGSVVGLYLLDLYTRDSKRGGAWMNSLTSQSSLLGHPVVVTNNLNVPKPSSGPTLLTYSEVTTLFHEFGHALHGLFARVTYPKFAGTRVFRDFVEFPSQVNEMWMLWPEVLANYAVHNSTGEPMPSALVQKLQDSSGFNEGFATSEYLAAALLDQAWHSLSVDSPAVDDVAAFEAAALASFGLDNPAVPTRYASTYFAHTFSGGYDAGYYSYIWSEVLDADTVEWFRSTGGLTRANGDRFRQRLLGVGGSVPPLEAFVDFRGRPAEIGPLLDRRGLNA